MEAPVEAEIGETEEGFEPDPALRELLKDLLNSLSLKLWSVSLLVEGRVKEDHFVRLFEGYRERLEHHTRRRDELLERARDLEPLEMALNEAKVGLGELEVRRTIGDLQEGEFEAKAPAYRWDIRHYEAEIAMRRGEIAFLDDLTQVMPGEEISKMKTITDRALRELNELERAGRVGSGTAAKVRASLDDDLRILGDF